MDMSLDDIITQTKGARRGGARGRGRGRGAGGRTTIVGRGRRRTTAPTRGGGLRRGNSDGVWSHDKFQDAGGPRRSAMGLRSGGGAGKNKITVSNLHFGVTDADITELFGELGGIKYASVHYDRSGRSMGKADIVFDRHTSAQQAITQYNGVPLDGRAMEIHWADEKPAATIGKSPRGGIMNRIQSGRINRTSGGGRGGFKAGRGATAGRGGGRGRGRGRGGRTQTKPPTAEELDADLDAYVSQNQK